MSWTYEARVAMGLISGNADRQHHNGNVRDDSNREGAGQHRADRTVQPHMDAVRRLRPSSYQPKHSKN